MKKDPSDRRRRILEAAREVGLKRGLASTRMDEIADTAGVSKGTLYNFFENRELLLIEAVLLSYSETVVMLPEVTDENAPPRQRLTALAESLAMSFERVVLEFPMASQALSLTPPGTDVHTRLLNGLNENYMGYRQYVGDLLVTAQIAGDVREDVDVNVLAAAWVATYNGLVYRAGFDEKGDDSLCTPEGVRRALGWLLEGSFSDSHDSSRNKSQPHPHRDVHRTN